MIRLATGDDLDVIVAIYNAAIPGRWSTADLEPILPHSRRDWLLARDTTRRPVWVAESQDGSVVAWLSVDDYKTRAAYWISAELSVYVDPAAQRRGHARALVAHAVEQAPALGLRTLLAVAFAHNTASNALFASFGFEPWGQLPRVTEMPGLDTPEPHERDVVILGRHV